MIEPGTAVRFINGKYKGFQGTIRIAGDTCACVQIVFEGRPCDVIEDFAHMMDLAEWMDKQSATERALKGNPTP